MDFNFYKQYNSYSNIDLIEIVRNSVNYQREAVCAAKKILTERNVSMETIQKAELPLINQNDVNNFEEKKIRWSKNANTFFELIQHPGMSFDAKKWIYTLCIVLLMSYLPSLIDIANKLIDFSTCADCNINFDLIFDVLLVIFAGLVLVLLFSKNRLGWILLFIDFLSTLTLKIFRLTFFEKTTSLEGNTGAYILESIIKFIVLYILCTKPITSLYNINNRTKNGMIIITSVVTTTIIFSGYFW